MTQAIKSSLRELHGAIETLENKVVEASSQKKKAEPDLFTVPLKNNASNDVDPKVLAGRLDSAIAKVEKLLREG